MDRIIFTVFQPVDHQWYSKLLHLYFPLEAKTKNEEKALTDKGGEEKVKEDDTSMAEDEGTKKEEEEEMEKEEAGTEEKEGARSKESTSEEDTMASIPTLQKSMTEPGRVITFLCVCVTVTALFMLPETLTTHHTVMSWSPLHTSH